jgi:hypothetical protein
MQVSDKGFGQFVRTMASVLEDIERRAALKLERDRATQLQQELRASRRPEQHDYARQAMMLSDTRRKAA